MEQQLFYGKVVTPCCASINSRAFCMFSPYIPVPLQDHSFAFCPDEYCIPILEYEAVIGLADIIHIDQVALVAAQKPCVIKLCLYFIQLFIHMVGAAIRPVQDALCIAAFYIHDLIDRDKFDRGFLHKPIAAALVFRQKPIQRVPDILNPVRLYDISGGIDAVAFQCIIGAGGAEYDSATVEELPQTFSRLSGRRNPP